MIKSHLALGSDKPKDFPSALSLQVQFSLPAALRQGDQAEPDTEQAGFHLIKVTKRA